MSREATRPAQATGNVADIINEAASQAENDPALDREALLNSVLFQVLEATESDPMRAMLRMAAVAIESKLDSNQRTKVLREIKHALKAKPTLAFFLGDTPSNNGGPPFWVVAPLGARGEIKLVSPLEAGLRPPPLLSLVETNEGVCVGPGPDSRKVALPTLEYDVTRVETASVHPDIGEIIVRDGSEHISTVVYAQRSMVETLRACLEDGQAPKVRVCGQTAIAIASNPDDAAQRRDDFVEYVARDGPRLHDLVFPKRLMAEWERDLRHILKGRHRKVALVGATGTGKSEAVYRAVREAAIRSGKQPVLILISAHTVGSMWHSESERNIARALKQAEKFAKKDLQVVVLFDEVDALLGDATNRYEGSVDRRVRLTVQQLLTKDYPGIFFYATMNAREDSPLPAAIASRFRHRGYPRTGRSQMATVISRCAAEQPEVLPQLGACAEELGRRVADFLYAPDFVVAKAHLHSGRVVDVRAADLCDMCPRKVRDVLSQYLLDVDDGAAAGLDPLLEAYEREFRKGATLFPGNLYGHTFLKPDPNDAVKVVEAVGG